MASDSSKDESHFGVSMESVMMESKHCSNSCTDWSKKDILLTVDFMSEVSES